MNENILPLAVVEVDVEVDVDDDGSSDCFGCGVDLSQLDEYHSTGCGIYCAPCMALHSAECDECASLLADEDARAAAPRNFCECGLVDHQNDFYYAHPTQTFCFSCMAEHRRECKACASTWSDDFKAIPSLFEGVVEGRAAAVAVAQGEALTLDLLAPLPSISKRAGLMESRSPLFSESPANPQLSLF